MKKIRIGVLGGGRGASMVSYCKRSDSAQIVALCDKDPQVLQVQRKKFGDLGITFYDNFDDFILHDMDAVVLANYANEHAPFAIRAMQRGLHVFSEVLPCQTMKEAVELIETVEQTGRIYAYGENYCYMPATREMKQLYSQGLIGEFEYGEGEYIHNCEPLWPAITCGEKDHWRNNMYATFYCTHSLGPIIHITGLRPVSVVGFEGTQNERKVRVGAKGASFGIEMVTLENGAIVKSIHGDLYKDSIWYCIYGSKGRMECAREDANSGHINRLYLNYDAFSGDYSNPRLENRELSAGNPKAAAFGHGGSDYYSMHCFVQRLLGNEKADIIDVYEAMDMFLPGMFAYRSILNGGKPMTIPNLRDKAQRELFRNDTACTDPRVAGDMLLPTTGGGTPDIDEGVYDYVKMLWKS
ncbi:MAG: Gfo/Idh/MocA family oxidoreductase [Oscillospiraceae bacterium]|nr:Gfo/Idh/MocA family oxidoreductase [Oscillospiraceae bacterium]